MEEKKSNAEVVAAENQQFGPNKQKFRDRFASSYPDIDMDDEEAYFGALNDQNDQMDKDKSRLDELEDSQRVFGEALSADPRLGELFIEMTRKGGKPIDLLIKNYAQAFSDLVNDPDNDEYRKALAEKIEEDLETAKSRRDMEAEADKNLEGTLEALNKVASERGLSDEEIADAFGKFVQLQQDLVVDKVSEEMWKVFIDGLYHDSDVTQARTEGETAGRNAKISEKLRTEQPSTMNMNRGGGSRTGTEGKKMNEPNFGSVWDE